MAPPPSLNPLEGRNVTEADWPGASAPVAALAADPDPTPQAQNSTWLSLNSVAVRLAPSACTSDRSGIGCGCHFAVTVAAPRFGSSNPIRVPPSGPGPTRASSPPLRPNIIDTSSGAILQLFGTSRK